ncbi:MAG: accessory factor UbiK family protein [Magnetospiraceae bacterium]
MQDPNRFFEGFSKMAEEALDTFHGMRAEIEKVARQQMERLLADSDMPTREEIEVLQDMLEKSRSDQAALEVRVRLLESALAEAKASPARKTAPKSTARTSKKKSNGTSGDDS